MAQTSHKFPRSCWENRTCAYLSYGTESETLSNVNKCMKIKGSSCRKQETANTWDRANRANRKAKQEMWHGWLVNRVNCNIELSKQKVKHSQSGLKQHCIKCSSQTENPRTKGTWPHHVTFSFSQYSHVLESEFTMRENFSLSSARDPYWDWHSYI